MDSRHQEPSSPTRQFDAAAAFEALPEAYLILNHRYEILLANARYLHLTGQSAVDLLGKSILDVNQFGSSEQREARRAWLTTALRELSTGESKWSPLFRYEMPGHAGAGGESETRLPRYWTIKASLLPARDGQASAIALRVSEVTERVSDYERDQRERAKLRSQAQLRRLLADEPVRLLICL